MLLLLVLVGFGRPRRARRAMRLALLLSPLCEQANTKLEVSRARVQERQRATG